MMATAVGSSSSLGGPTATTLAREFEPIYLNEEQQNSVKQMDDEDRRGGEGGKVGRWVVERVLRSL